jgi:hypothetical protein
MGDRTLQKASLHPVEDQEPTVPTFHIEDVIVAELV